MKKLVMFIMVLSLVSLMSCASQKDIEKTKNQTYEDVTFATLLDDYKYSNGSTEWYQEDQKVIAESKIFLSEELELTQKLVFTDYILSEIIWESQDNVKILKSEEEQQEILNLIYNQEIILKSKLDLIHHNVKKILGQATEELYKQFKTNTVKDIF